MKKLQKKILKKVVSWEKKQIILFLFKTFFFFLIVFFILFFIFRKIIKILNTFQSWVVFEIFFENFEVLRRYGKEVLYTLYLEIPKLWIILLLIGILILLWWIKNSLLKIKKVKNKIISLKKILQTKL